MSDALTYHAALELLGKTSRSRLLTLLDGVATIGLTAWAAGALAAGRGVELPVSVFELKTEVVLYAHETVRRISEWRTGLSRFDRSERLAAAHAVLVISSYFEAAEQADLPVSMERLALTRAEQAALATGSKVPDGYVEMIEFLLREPLPLPEPHQPHAEVRHRLASCYDGLSDRLLKLISGLAVWEELDDDSKHALNEAIRALPPRALDRYDDGYRFLAMDNREFAVWAGLTEVRSVGAALSGVSSLLAEMTLRRPGQRPRTHLAMSYHAGLSEPIIGSGQAPEGVVLPSLGEGYVNPVCRVAEIGPGDRPEEGQWWESRELVPDIETFFAGYLTSPRAARLPLVVLGEPGSGKSKLAEVLAARLPEQDFLPVLVQLRDVAAESMIQEQIEQAIFRRPGERVSWHDLIEAAEEALPVVLLDGFDELVQASAVNRYDYLEQVRDFQLRQAQVGHPVAVIVTSRTVVADLVRFPVGSLALQLQPFSDDQVHRWLEIWDRHNASVLGARGLRPLPAETALAHRELAEQPLLLLLVAIFDAADNGLQRLDTRMGRAELYERLLTEFAFREISKSARNRALSALQQRQLAIREVQRLSVVALAMFNRGRQAAGEAELNQDLPVLFAEDDDTEIDSDAALTPAQRAVGRFFFVHKSEARRRDERTRTYEFLHATFEEFLVARLAVTALRDITEYRQVTRRGTTAAGPLDDGFLYAVLSFSCLASRTPIVRFMGELLHQIPGDERARCREMLSDLIAGSLYPHPSRSFQLYEPMRYPIPRRLACYSANLVLMLVVIDGEVSATEFCGTVDTGRKWAQYGYLWRSAFTTSEWNSLIDTMRVRVSRKDGPLEIKLAMDDGSPVSPTDSLVVTEKSSELTSFDIHLSPREEVSYDVDISSSNRAGRIFREIAFTPSWHTGMLLLQTVPYLRAFGGEIRYQQSDGTADMPGYMLARLDYARRESPSARLQLYESYATAMAISTELREQFLLRLLQDVGNLPALATVGILRNVSGLPPTGTYIAILNRLWEKMDSREDRNSLIEFVSDLRRTWPEDAVNSLNKELLSHTGGRMAT